MRILLFCVCIATLYTTPCSALTLGELEDNLSSVDVLRAQYLQTRYVSGLAAPLESSGAILLARNTGLVWSQDVPFRVVFVLTDNIITEEFDGQPRKVKKKEKNVELFRFVGLFSSIFAGDKTALEKTFDINFVPMNGDHWEMNLEPNMAKVQKVFSKIKLRGSRLVEDVEIFETSGSRTVIHFNDITTSPTMLSIDEKHYFQN